MSDNIVWQLPDRSENTKGEIDNRVKYHCFVDDNSLCGTYWQTTDYYDMKIESGEIEMRPEIACKKCYNKWKKMFNL